MLGCTLISIMVISAWAAECRITVKYLIYIRRNTLNSTTANFQSDKAVIWSY